MDWFILILIAFLIIARILGFYKKDDSENYLINRPWVQCHESPPRHAFNIKVLKVITGNSLLAELPKEFLEEKKELNKEPFFILRLNHIEMPEYTQRGGRAAVLAFEGLLIGKEVKAVFQHSTIYFEESLATLYADDRNVNLELTANGLAWINKKYNKNLAYWELLQKAQIKGFGIWSLNRNIPPWKYRKYSLSNEQRQH
tara:strand:- start:1587 stop:2186 length:600 start_codon:yes stop_codon:yes gene_type:complete